MNVMERWTAKGGYKEALVIGFPLVVSMVSSTVMTFTDRMFLGNYSTDTLAASVPASVTAFMFLAFFLGVAQYAGVFVAQFTGSGRHEDVGRSLWQGLWFCLPAWVVLASLWFLARPLFELSGHPPQVIELEIAYFKILTVGGGAFVVSGCLSCFYSGRGMTKPIMVISLLAMIVNVPLDYCFINGVGPFPELGIVGAGLATVTGYVLPVICYSCLIFTAENEKWYRVRSGWRFDRKLFTRFLRFGLPGGVEFFLDLFAVSFFVFMIGRFGQVELAATNAVFSIYNIAFLPTIGLHVAASVMVGQAMGDGKPDQAAYATRSVLHLAIVYMACMAVLFIGLPDVLMNMFKARGESAADFHDVLVMGVMLMKFTAVFTMIDAVAVVHVGGLKGAGDTKYIMKTMFLSSMMCIVIPLLILNYLGIRQIYAPWTFLLLYALTMSVSFVVRFYKGPWRHIRVIPD
ncbi:MATE family efflux transporter [Pseudodesulfovibrio sp. JC047]|uniref:MATE family efflux transporter n=1 Tax=Pseudodesulfovibrio sp. JC047 TaxID=2683199 RepID=UPI0013D56A6F|nr:MATE family efflux transporter [Pseudodesulfovibrio sp. JC047]NDV19986.1 MATE family efflux transporter [Pseudodesulfovibrio sp. JC047]